MEANADRITSFIPMASSYWVSQMIHVAAELALADHLAAAGPTGLSA